MEAQLAEMQKHIIKTYDKWCKFLQEVEDPETYKEHTIIIENAYQKVKEALILIKDSPDRYANEQLDLVEYTEKWRFLDRNIDRFISEKRHE